MLCVCAPQSGAQTGKAVNLGKKYKVFVVNPGSTSTKIALFVGEEKVFSQTVDFDAQLLRQFQQISDQMPLRYEGIIKAIEENHLDMTGLDAISCMCGGTATVEGGVYRINDLLYEHARIGFSAKHPNTLGPLIARRLQERYGGELFTVNPPDVDELNDYERICGFHEFTRVSKDHPLNQKENALRFARAIHKRYEDINIIVCHLGGGVTIAAHEHGRIVSLNNCIEGDGPMAPTRAGALPAMDLVRLCFSGKYTQEELYRRITKDGGLVDHLGTSDVREIVRRIQAGDRYAKLVYDAFIYQIGKAVGGCAAVLKGQVDGIVLTGGIAYDEYLVSGLREYISWIAPVAVQAGEFEMEALAAGAIRVMSGEEEPKEYTGEPVWKGFDEYKTERRL